MRYAGESVGGLRDRRPRRIRVTHASTKDLRLALEEIQRGLLQVNSAEKIQAVNDEIDRLCLALDARVALAKTRADCLRQAELIKRELQSEGRALGASLKRINREINEEEAALRRERRALLSARERLQHLEAEALLDNHIIERIQDELTGLDEDAEADEIEAKQVELSRLTDLTDAFSTSISPLPREEAQANAERCTSNWKVNCRSRGEPF